MKAFAVSLLATSAAAYPWVAKAPGVDSSLLSVVGRHTRRQQTPEGAGSEANCPFNPNHVPAPGISAAYPYNYAKNGQMGHQKGGYLVPDPNDKAHQYVAPNPKTDIRGPCPGLNTAANHNFLAHDGVTTYNELVDAQQNLYNVGYDLANTLALLGLTLTDGDPVTMKLSIGCDATSRTSSNQALTGHEPGLDGHNKFEADASLTRNDFFTHNGDDFTFNKTLFNMMSKTCNNNFDITGLSLYRKQRWQQSQRENPNFFYGPLSLLEYGAASFLYELMPTAGGQPDLPTISSFFVKEKVPDNWRARVTPYTNNDVTEQILAMYALNPVLFGGNTASGSFDTINYSDLINNGTLNTSLSEQQTSCFLYQLLTGPVPSSLNGVVTPTANGLSLIASKLNPTLKNLGCPIALD